MIAPTYVVSDNIDCVGYQHGTLYIRFKKTGQCYAYKGVGFSTFDALAKAESVGKFFNAFVKNKYPLEKLEFDPFVVRKII